VIAFVGLGSNVGDRLGQLRAALRSLAQLPGTTLTGTSSIYETRPLGPPGQECHLNAVARLDTTLRPIDLLAHLQGLEAAAGRTREVPWGPRTLDLDLLLVLDERGEPSSLDTPTLQLPHPGLLDRDFVLAPLAELAPELLLQGTAIVAHLVRIPAERRTVLRVV
jgi:2-amino-4-hydroxy-6-hydroxymethyldihydropteridine diphosphokinase